MVARHVSPTKPSGEELIRWGANSAIEVFARGQWWRTFTSMFVHIGIAHLILNMWALWVIGQLAEILMGTGLFFWTYIAAGLAGSLASLFWHPLGVGAGASGAIFGMLGTVVALLKFARLPIPPDALKSTLRSVTQAIFYSLAIGLFPSIDNAAHVGGLVCGVLIGLLLSWTRRMPVLQQPMLRRASIAGVFIILVPLALAVRKHGQPAVHFQQSAEALAGDRYKDAEREARLLLQQYPRNHAALELLTSSLQYQGRDTEAATYLRGMLDREPRDVYALNNLAAIDLRAGNAAAARDVLTRGLSAQPRNAQGHVLLGQALRDLNDTGGAVTQYRQAISLDPQSYDADYGLAELYEAAHNPAQALALYQAASKLQPNDPNPLRGMVRCLQALGATRQLADVNARLAEVEKKHGVKK
jgi:membrane associated rhomboid family serine protease/Flp pilus assembly protein TadD